MSIVSESKSFNCREARNDYLGLEDPAVAFRSIHPELHLTKATKDKGKRRREVILHAFETCVERYGYTNTTMARIAAEACMAPGHLAYYFRSKEEILRSCYSTQAKTIINEMKRVKEVPLDRRIDYIADLFFTNNSYISSFTTGLMFEGFSVAMNNKNLKRCRLLMDQATDDIFIGLIGDFLKDEDPSTIKERAHMAYAFLSGLKFSFYFEGDDGLKEGRRLFQKVLHTLCGNADL